MRIAFSSLRRNIKASPAVSKVSTMSMSAWSIFVRRPAFVCWSILEMFTMMFSVSSSGHWYIDLKSSTVEPLFRCSAIKSTQSSRMSFISMHRLYQTTATEGKR